MVFHINHIHIKSHKPRQAAEWFVSAFNFRILSDEVRASGDQFVRCETENGQLRINFSGERNGEPLQPGIVGVHTGLEHFGIDSTDCAADVARLQALGATLIEGPKEGRGGQVIAFMDSPEHVRMEIMQPPK